MARYVLGKDVKTPILKNILLQSVRGLSAATSKTAPNLLSYLLISPVTCFMGQLLFYCVRVLCIYEWIRLCFSWVRICFVRMECFCIWKSFVSVNLFISLFMWMFCKKYSWEMNKSILFIFSTLYLHFLHPLSLSSTVYFFYSLFFLSNILYNYSPLLILPLYLRRIHHTNFLSTIFFSRNDYY